MELYSHGGKCCGIKTIFSLSYDPASVWQVINNAQRKFADHCGAQPWFKGDAPAESGIKRLKRYVEQVQVDRPGHIIEVVTATACNQTEQWRPYLEALGFKEVTKAKNSNSHQIVSIWHCVVENGILRDASEKKVKEKEKVVQPVNPFD